MGIGARASIISSGMYAVFIQRPVCYSQSVACTLCLICCLHAVFTGGLHAMVIPLIAHCIHSVARVLQINWFFY